MINVLVVDDQNLTHKLIETYLQPEQEIKIVGYAKTGQQAIEQIPNLQPDIVLMDVEMPEMDGLIATKIITQEFANTKVVILTVYDDEQHLSKALKNGAKGYLLKNTMAQELKNAIFYANQGYFQLSLELTDKYLPKIINSPSETEEVSKLKKKVDYLHQTFNQLANKFQLIKDDHSQASLEDKIAELLKKEIALLNNREASLKDNGDSHLQFKIDRIKHDQQKLQRKVKLLLSTQLCYILVSLLVVVYFIFSKSN